MTTTESNKLIAEFMEFKGTNNCIRNSESGRYYDYHANANFSCIKEEEIQIESEWGSGLVEQDFLFIEDLKFHSSWDWLMPVVDKIESLDFVVQVHLGSCFIKSQEQFIAHKAKYISKYQSKSKIEAVYNAVVEFIKWYNENGKK